MIHPNQTLPSTVPAVVHEGKSDRRIAIALFIGVFAVYAATLCRTIYTGDDGDFITAMATWGVSHPTGYPLFTLLGRFFIEVVPFGSPALRINIMTAVCGAASAALFYRFAALLVPQRFWAATAALLFAFAPTLWQQSLSCEVYSLTCLFLATLLYLAVLWYARPDDTRLLGILAFVFGLALTNHLSTALFLPAFLVLVFGRRRSLWREGRVLLSLVALFIIPLGIYAYLPLAAGSNPPVPWGDPSTPSTFLEHVSGKQYRVFMNPSPSLMWKHFKDYGGYLLGEYGLWSLWLVPVGIVALWRRSRALCALLLYIWIVNVAFSIQYNIFDIYVYYLPSYLVVAALLALGASAVMQATWDRLRLPQERRAHYATLVAAVALIVPVVQMSLNYVKTDKSRNFIEEDFAGNVLKSAPRGAVVLTGSNVTFTLWYKRFVLGERTDVTHINWVTARGMFFANAWYYKHLRRMYPDIRNTYPDHRATEAQAASGEFILRMMKRAVARGVPVIVIGDERVDEFHSLGSQYDTSYRQMLTENFDIMPWGIGERLYPKGESPSLGVIVTENERLWASFSTRGLKTGWAHADPLQEHLMLRYADAGVAFGTLAEKAGRYAAAKAAYEHSLALYRIPEAEAGRARCAHALEEMRRASR